MNYLERLKDQDKDNEKALRLTAKKSKLQADADLLEVESQIVEEEQKLEELRSTKEGYSLTEVVEQIIKIDDLNSALGKMNKEYKAEFK